MALCRNYISRHFWPETVLESSKYDHKYLKNDQKVLFFEQIVLLQGFRVIEARRNFILAFFIYGNSVESIFPWNDFAEGYKNLLDVLQGWSYWKLLQEPHNIIKIRKYFNYFESFLTQDLYWSDHKNNPGDFNWLIGCQWSALVVSYNMLFNNFVRSSIAKKKKHFAFENRHHGFQMAPLKI